LDARTPTDAVREMEALRTDHARGVAPATRSLVPTISELAAEYLQHLEARVHHRDATKRAGFCAQSRSGRPVTSHVALYRQRLRDHVVPELGHHPVDQLRVDHLRQLIERKGTLAPGTVTSLVNITSGMLRYAVKHRYVDRNVVRDLDRDDRPGSMRLTEPRYLDQSEIVRLIDAVGPVFRPVIVTCATTGLRISEALGLRWRDIDLDAGSIQVCRQLDDDLTTRDDLKSPASRATVRILPALDRELRALRAGQAETDLRRVHRDALVFVTNTGQPQSRRNALRALHIAGDRCGLNSDGRERVGLHDLRHSLISQVMAGTRDLDITATVARHANPGVTSTMYVGLADARRAGIAQQLVDAGIGT
jgi:integrase